MVYKKIVKLSVLLTPLLSSLSSNAVDSRSAALAAGAAAVGAAAVAGAKYLMPKSQEAKVQEALDLLTLDEHFMALAQAANKLDEHNQGKIAMALKLPTQSKVDALIIDAKQRAYEEGLEAAAVFVQEQYSDAADAINANAGDLSKKYRAELNEAIKKRQESRAAAQATTRAGAAASDE